MPCPCSWAQVPFPASAPDGQPESSLVWRQAWAERETEEKEFQGGVGEQGPRASSSCSTL